MSYDLRIWCLKELPESEEGTAEAATDWLVDVSAGTFVPEEMPQEVNEKHPGIRYVVDLSLEPGDAPSAGINALWRVAHRIAKLAQGVIEDPQSDSLAVAPGAKRKRGLSQAEVEARRNTPERLAQRAKWEAEHKKRIAENLRAQEPVLSDLRAAGFAVDKISSLDSLAPYARALPILAEHLARPHPPSVRASIARRLAVPEAKFAWKVVTEAFRNEPEGVARQMLANAVTAIADDEVIGDVIELARDTRQANRALLLPALERSKDPRALETLFALQTDPELAKAVQASLRRLTRRKR
jgi:hypothetical protein